MLKREKQQVAAVANSTEYVREVVVSAFDQSHKNQKDIMRAVNRVLSLAKTRGYNHADQFVDHFKKVESQSKSVSNRLLRNLFEYVSAEEFISLVHVKFRKML